MKDSYAFSNLFFFPIGVRSMLFNASDIYFSVHLLLRRQKLQCIISLLPSCSRKEFFDNGNSFDWGKNFFAGGGKNSFTSCCFIHNFSVFHRGGKRFFSLLLWMTTPIFNHGFHMHIQDVRNAWLKSVKWWYSWVMSIANFHSITEYYNSNTKAE